MNALIKKEIRLLLPAWIAAMLLAIAPIWIVHGMEEAHDSNIFLIPGFCLMLGTLFLGIASFGQEFSFRTFTLLLSQPISRKQIWRIKTFLLGMAFISVLAAVFISMKIYAEAVPAYALDFSNNLSHFGIILLWVFAFFGGGLWTTLLLRQVTAAFWLTLLVPAAVLISSAEVADYYHLLPDKILAGLFLFYSIAGFFWARRMFLRAQDTQWTGGEISFSWRKKSSEQTAAAFSSRPRHWFSMLVRKEFQLHQTTIVIALVVLALHLASVFIRKFHPHFINTAYKDVLDFIWSLWLLMPLVIGSTAIAEERRLGVIESQLCLPVSRRTQLFIKFSVGLVLSVILGALIPLLVEGPKHFTDRPQGFIFAFFCVPAAAIFFISFYASTLARTTLQAIGITIGICAGLWAWIAGIGFGLGHLQRGQNEWANTYQAFFVINLSAAILLLVLTWLIFGNFKWLHENWKLWRRNLMAIVASLVFSFVLANGIYFRTWELLSPVEPSHGQVRLNDSTRAKFVANQNTIFATLPDGRLWVETLGYDHGINRWGEFTTLAPNRSRSQFIGGTNWAEMTADNFQMLGVQSDGSLWSLQRKWNPSQNWWLQTGDFKLTQIGSETNWQQTAGGRFGFLLLKKGGDLWIWGTNAYEDRDISNSIPLKFESDLATAPVRLGDETNWSEVFSEDSWYRRIAGTKNNAGEVFQLSVAYEKNSEKAYLQNTNLSGISFGDDLDVWRSVGIDTNGEVWFFWNEWKNSHYIPQGRIQLGQHMKWRTVGFDNYDSVVALRSDGTLWQWPLHGNDVHNLASIKPVQLGSHSDWIAFSTHNSWALALAPDGSLWAWDEPSEHIWLAPSRKPVFIGNIFKERN
jgi:ABC-2 family transporter protein